MSYVESVRTFIRVFDLGSMSAAARDLRISPAVASARISQLENHLNTRLFSRTTRSLQPTEHGRVFYEGATRILDAIADAEAALTDATRTPRGTIFVAAPLSVGRKLLGPLIPGFKEQNPLVDIRLRLSDRKVDLMTEGLDVVLFQGTPEDSNLKWRRVVECPRVLCASPDYIAQRGSPETGEALISDSHDCLTLRFPGAAEFQWTLQTAAGLKKFAVSGPFETDDGDVLTDWAIAGSGIIMKPYYEVAAHLASGALVQVCKDVPPLPHQLGFLYAHRRNQDPKLRAFIDHMSGPIRAAVAAA